MSKKHLAESETLQALQALYERTWFIIGVNDPVAVKAQNAISNAKAKTCP